MRLAGQAPHRRFPLSSNLRRRRSSPVRVASLLLLVVPLCGCSLLPVAVDHASDEPDLQRAAHASVPTYGSYAEALAAWRAPEDVSAWVGAYFEYDRDRALALSESQRSRGSELPIREPRDFYARPKGVCVDLARFAVETLKQIRPGAKPRYLMIEFEPSVVRGQVLRRHWVVSYDGPGGIMITADSKRPGATVGPYRSIEEYVAEYATYRERRIVAYRETSSYTRTLKSRARQMRGDA